MIEKSLTLSIWPHMMSMVGLECERWPWSWCNEANAVREPIDENTRSELVRLARDKKRRVIEFTNESPIEWRPGTVFNPETGLYFTDIGAWHFAADLLEEGHPCRCLVLDRPPGGKGYEMTGELKGNLA